jgi:general secretion pathway protein C
MSRLKTHVAGFPAWRQVPWAGLGAGAVWLLVAGSAVHWGMQLLVRGQTLPAQVQTVGVDQALQGDPARLFARAVVTSAPAASPASDRFRVLGAMAGEDGGLALLSVDGRPPRAYRVGAAVDAQWVVQAVSQRAIQIGPMNEAAVLSLALPSLPDAATGRLPTAAAAGLISVPSQNSSARPATLPNAGPEGGPPNGMEPMPEAPVPR